jgi:hypothetical protein
MSPAHTACPFQKLNMSHDCNASWQISNDDACCRRHITSLRTPCTSQQC